MQALVDAAGHEDFPASIVGILSNKPDAAGLAFATARGIPTAVRSHRDFATREGFDAALDEVLAGWQAEVVCLAGFMRVLSAGFVERWSRRMINIHPSLLPAYRGLHTHERALADKVREHGCTVHFVTPGLDEGPTILQSRVPVMAGDTAETLAERVLAEEHRIYPEALALVARGLLEGQE